MFIFLGGPCQDMKPIFLEHSKNFITIQFLEVDVDELEEVASSANIRAMPTFKVIIIIKNF